MSAPTPARTAGPVTLALFGARSAGDYLAGLMTLHAREGDRVRLGLGDRATWALFHPDDVGAVLREQSDRTSKAQNYERHAPLHIRYLGRGLLTNDGEPWLRTRRAAAGAMHRGIGGELAGLCVSRARALSERWLAGGPRVIDVRDDLAALTMGVAARGLFGFEGEGDEALLARAARAVGRISEGSIRALTKPWTRVLDRVRNRPSSAREDVAVIDALAAAIIARGGRAPLLDRLRALELDPARLRDEVVTLLVGAFESNHHALTWALYELAGEPAVQTRLREELRASAPDAWPALEYPRSVAHEVLRLYPQGPVLTRAVREELPLAGLTLPVGARVLVSPWVTHRHRAHWKHPERFDPARFDEAAREARHPYAYFPFGAGPRRCVGEHFGLLQLTLALSALVERARFSRREGPVPLRPLVAITPGGPVRLYVEPAS